MATQGVAQQTDILLLALLCFCISVSAVTPRLTPLSCDGEGEVLGYKWEKTKRKGRRERLNVERGELLVKTIQQ